MTILIEQFSQIKSSPIDLEKLRIGLSWLTKNRGKIKVHYLKNYNSADELAANFIMPKKSDE